MLYSIENGRFGFLSSFDFSVVCIFAFVYFSNRLIHVSVCLLQLLQHEKLDLKLTPYKVLATSGKSGTVYFDISTACSINVFDLSLCDILMVCISLYDKRLWY